MSENLYSPPESATKPPPAVEPEPAAPRSMWKAYAFAVVASMLTLGFTYFVISVIDGDEVDWMIGVVGLAILAAVPFVLGLLATAILKLTHRRNSSMKDGIRIWSWIQGVVMALFLGIAAFATYEENWKTTPFKVHELSGVLPPGWREYSEPMVAFAASRTGVDSFTIMAVDRPSLDAEEEPMLRDFSDVIRKGMIRQLNELDERRNPEWISSILETWNGVSGLRAEISVEVLTESGWEPFSLEMFMTVGGSGIYCLTHFDEATDSNSEGQSFNAILETLKISRQSPVIKITPIPR